MKRKSGSIFSTVNCALAARNSIVSASLSEYTFKYIGEIDKLKDEKFSTAVQTGELNQLQEQLTDIELKKIKDKVEDIWWDVKDFTLADIKAWWLVAAVVIWYLVW